MVIGVIGENFSGKSTLASALKKTIGAEIFTGKDYLRMAKSEREAEQAFRAKLQDALVGAHIVYVISEAEHVKLLPDGAIRILVQADIETIKTRFKNRMHGNLPPPVEQMLLRKHGMFDDGLYDYRFDGVSGDCAALCAAIRDRLSC